MNLALSRLTRHSLRRYVTHYDGTPKSIAHNDGAHLGGSFDLDIPTVTLAYDLHVPEKEPRNFQSPLFFLHGIFGSKTNNRTVAKQLANQLNRNVYCLDLRNFGQSPHASRLDYPALAADVEKFIDSCKFPTDAKPIVIGHSMGAKATMALALRRPDLPRMIVSVDNAPIDLSGGTAIFSKYIGAIRKAIEYHKFTNIKDVDAELAKVEPNATVRQFLLTNLNRGKKDDIITSKIPLQLINNAIVEGRIASWPFDPNVARWSKGPALFIRGTKSNYVPDEALPEIGKYFPNFEVRDIDSGHWVISEKPQEFIDTLVDFISRHEDD